MQTVTNDDLNRAVETIKEHVKYSLEPSRIRLDQIESHLRTLNGKVADHARKLADTDTELKSRAAVRLAVGTPVTRREFWLGVTVLGTAGLFILWALNTFNAARDAMTVVGP